MIWQAVFQELVPSRGQVQNMLIYECRMLQLGVIPLFFPFDVTSGISLLIPTVMVNISAFAYHLQSPPPFFKKLGTSQYQQFKPNKLDLQGQKDPLLIQ